jgi:hypothetical protein
LSVRFSRTGTGVVKDHNELANKGVYPHNRLDQLVEEVDAARGTFPDLSARLAYIQSHSTGGGGGDTGGGGSLPSNYLYEVFKPRFENTSLITLSTGQYEPGTGELELFKNGVRQKQGTDYQELTPSSFQLFEPLLLTDIVVCRVRDRAGTILPVSIKREHVLVTESTTSTLTMQQSVLKRGRSLEVYADGMLLAENEDYTILDEHTVTFLQLPAVGSLLYFQVIDKTVEFTPRLLQEFLPTDGVKTQFTLSKFSYQPDADELELYLNGIHLIHKVDYEEIDTTTIAFFQAPPTGELLVCKENRKKSSYEIALENRVTQLEEKLNFLMQELGVLLPTASK